MRSFRYMLLIYFNILPGCDIDINCAFSVPVEYFQLM